MLRLQLDDAGARRVPTRVIQEQLAVAVERAVAFRKDRELRAATIEEQAVRVFHRERIARPAGGDQHVAAVGPGGTISRCFCPTTHELASISSGTIARCVGPDVERRGRVSSSDADGHAPAVRVAEPERYGRPETRAVART